MSDQLDGFARCVNQGCEAFDQDQPVALVCDKVVQTGWPGEPFARTPITETSYLRVADDKDLTCPECSQPRAIVDGKAHAYPKAAIG